MGTLEGKNRNSDLAFGMLLTREYWCKLWRFRARSLISTPSIKHIVVGLLKVKSKYLFLNSKVSNFRRLGVYFQMNLSQKDFEKKLFLCQKGVEIRVLDGKCCCYCDPDPHFQISADPDLVSVSGKYVSLFFLRAKIILRKWS